MQIARIGVDWGISNVRAFAVSDKGTVLAEAHSNKGMSTLQQMISAYNACIDLAET